MTEERSNELYDLWEAETEAPETQQWRRKLTPEEIEEVQGWDDEYSSGLYELCAGMMNLDTKQKEKSDQ